jgi:hypothetical protein
VPDINDVIRYFDLQSDARQRAPQAQTGGEQPTFPVVPQYLALVAGIAVQPFLAAFQKNHVWDVTGWQGWVVFSFIVGLILFPAIYKKAFDPQQNLFVQLCAIFASGLGWQSLMQTAASAANIAK